MENGSTVFSLSGVALYACFISAEELDQVKIDKLIYSHQDRFLILFASLYVWNDVQESLKFLGNNFQILLVHNIVNAINFIFTIIRITSKQNIVTSCYRMLTA